ncbi:MAG: HAD family phosphatase [Ruminococcaceae bacterium]|nr:HAD family phosphatase [Oscillospiraceae bacterium]
MGKFDGYLICSDVDGTLINDGFKIPEANIKAIQYFQSEGGLFTLATGRTPQGAHLYINEVNPNAPIVCQNGAAIYDNSMKKYLWTSPLEDYAYDIIEYAVKKHPDCGVEVLCEGGIYYVRENAYTTKHMIDEKFEVIRKDYRDIKEHWLKILFADGKEGADKIQKDLSMTSFADKYQLVRSHVSYYEVLEKTTNKGKALKKLKEILNINAEKIIAIGDNDNDGEMLLAAPNSYAVESASEYAKKCAKYMLDADNNDGAIARLIEVLEENMK